MTLVPHPALNIPRIGDKIEILGNPEPEDILPPGSQGYVLSISRFLIDDYSMTMTLHFQMIRPEYVVYEINFPIIWNKELQQDEKYFSTLPVDLEYYVHFETKKNHESVRNLIGLEFLGWASARAEHLKGLRGEANRKVYWPEDKAHPINRLLRYSHIAQERGVNEVIHHFDPDNPLREEIILALRELEAFYFKFICTNTCRYLEAAEAGVAGFFIGLEHLRKHDNIISDYLKNLNPEGIIEEIRDVRSAIIEVLE